MTDAERLARIIWPDVHMTGECHALSWCDRGRPYSADPEVPQMPDPALPADAIDRKLSDDARDADPSEWSSRALTRRLADYLVNAYTDGRGYDPTDLDDVEVTLRDGFGIVLLDMWEAQKDRSDGGGSEDSTTASECPATAEPPSAPVTASGGAEAEAARLRAALESIAAEATVPDLDLNLNDIERSLDRQRSDGGCVPTVEWVEIDALMAEAVEGLLDEVDKLRGNLASCEEALAMAEAAFAVPAEYIANQRSLGWPDIHPEDYCHRCGRPNPLWHAESQAWYDATGMTEPGDGGGVMCPNCFTEAYKAAHPGERVLFWVTTKTYENGVWMSDHDAVTNETLSALRDKDAEILRLDTIIGNWNAERCDKPKGHVFASDVGFDEVRDERDRLLAENQRLRQVEGTARSLVQAVGPNPPPHLYHPVVALRALLGDGRDEALAPFGGDRG